MLGYCQIFLLCKTICLVQLTNSVPYSYFIQSMQLTALSFKLKQTIFCSIKINCCESRQSISYYDPALSGSHFTFWNIMGLVYYIILHKHHNYYRFILNSISIFEKFYYIRKYETIATFSDTLRHYFSSFVGANTWSDSEIFCF